MIEGFKAAEKPWRLFAVAAVLSNPYAGGYSYEYERLMPGMDTWEAGQGHARDNSALAQENGPPIWIAARDPNSHEFGVHNGFNIQVTPLWQGEEEINTSDQPMANPFVMR